MALWKETDGWDVEPDGETTEEMLAVAARDRAEDAAEAARNKRLWALRHCFDRNGNVVIRPPRRPM